MRSFQFSIVKLKIGNNEPQWRASVLTASSLLGADHQLDGTRVVSLTQAQYDQMSALHGTQAKAMSPSMPPLERPIKQEPTDSVSQKKRQLFESEYRHDATDPWAMTPGGSPHGSDDGKYSQGDEHSTFGTLEDHLGPLASFIPSEQLLARKYANTLMKQGMRSRRWYVSWDTTTETMIEEGPVDRLRRTLLGKKMRESLSDFPHLLREVGEYDIAAMWNAVAQLEQPEPYEILVREIRRLVSLEKGAKTSLQAWLAQLEEIFDNLAAVEFPVNDMLRIGFTLALLESDTRYSNVLKEAKTKVWPYDKILRKLGRHAVVAKDTAAATASDSSSTAKHEQHAHENRSSNSGKGGKGKGKGGKGRENSRMSDSEQITKLKEQQKKDRAQLPCPYLKLPEGCRQTNAGRTCDYKHGKATTPGNSKTSSPTKDPSPQGGGKSKPGEAICFAFAENGECPRQPNCKYKHVKQVQFQENHVLTHVMSVHDLDRPALENIAPVAISGDLVEISPIFAKHHGVYATVLSSSVTTYGKEGLTRVYKLRMSPSLAYKIHPGFANELSYGIPERFIIVDDSKKHETNQHGSECLLPTLDSASTVDMINTDRFFIPGTIRDTQIAVTFNDSDASAIKPAKSGLVLIATKVPNRYIARRMLHHPRAKRTIISIPKLRDLGYTFTLSGDHTSVCKDGVELLNIARKNKSDGSVTQVDRDNYVTEFDVAPDSIFVHPDTLGNVLYNYDACDRQECDVRLPPRSDSQECNARLPSPSRD